MSNTTLPCRLLCASKVAEEVNGTSLSPDPCYYEPFGFEADPVVITGGSDDIDACLVGTNADGVILAFRGTLPPAPTLPSILDWLQDFLAVLVSKPGLPGKVHEGFYDSVDAIWTPLLAEVRRQVAASGKDLIVTGHSKGAAMATIASMRLHAEEVPIQQVRTYASPNAGDAAFASAYDAVFSGSSVQNRYLNHLDVVPLLPPTDALATALAEIPGIGFLFKVFEDAGYTPVGNGIYIESGGQLLSHAADPVQYDAEILQDLADIKAAFQDHAFSKIADAHSLSCGFGYMAGVCQETVCGSPKCARG